MTSEEIDKMEAGREMDALIAEKVMGWKRGRPWGNGNGEWIIDGKGYPQSPSWGQTPSYSTSISAAWKIVEKFAGQVTIQGPKSVDFNQGSDYPDDWTVGFADVTWSDIRGVADTAPLAISRAALKAIRVRE